MATKAMSSVYGWADMCYSIWSHPQMKTQFQWKTVLKPKL